MDIDFNDFTENAYLGILRSAKKNYSFSSYKNITEGKHVLWRHDVDCSMHRALRLAKIEAEENVKSTYFFHLHSAYYNLFEDEIFEIGRVILSAGHYLGLHFDAGIYKEIKSLQDLKAKLAFEKNILEELFSQPVEAFSYHNPEQGELLKYSDFEVAGMVNAYSKDIKDKYFYCSDSNGYWRYSRLQDVVSEAKYDSLQILTHPEWWVPEPMSPRERISRCIDGRASALHKFYDGYLRRIGRVNVR